MNKLGFKTLLIDKDENNIGGDCLNTGCVPSKALIHISRLVHDARQTQEFGLNISGEIDVKKVMKYIFDKQEIIRDHENAEYFRNEGLDVAIGEARFHDSNSIIVNDQLYRAKRYVIATGSTPKTLPLTGLEHVQSYTNEDVFDLKELPQNMVVVGAGPIGLELGQAFSRLGVKISVVDVADRILLKEEAEIADILKGQLEKEDIKFHLNAKPIEVTAQKELIIQKDGNTEKLPCDAVLFAVGRTLNHSNLDLEKAGIKLKDNTIQINDYLRTTNKRVYVCGDAVGSLQFSHGAELHARIILNNFFSTLKKKLTYKNFSWVTFTSPEVATFGLTLSDLEQKGISFERLSLDFKDDDRAIVDNYQYGKLVLYVQQTNAVRRNPKIRLNSLFDKIYSYPTASRVNQAIVVNKKMNEITPSVKKLLKLIY